MLMVVVVVVVNERETSARLKTQIIVSYDKRTIKCIFAPTEKWARIVDMKIK